MANGRFKELFIEIFAWWRGATWGTRLWVARQGVFVGEDEFGNRYFRSKKPTGPHGMERRMVIYAGDYAEASAIPPGWYGWMHYRTNILPTEESYVPHAWEKPHLRNLTGTAGAYHPDGSLLNKGQRPRVAGDYDAWSPE
jgi:NADH:ubiquinone oxidoreductase subunit